jgi:hypothetical protein
MIYKRTKVSKIILEFDGIEEHEEAMTAMNATNWKLVVWDLDPWLRGPIKHAPDDISNDTYKALEECRDKLHEIVNDSNLTLD